MEHPPSAHIYETDCVSAPCPCTKPDDQSVLHRVRHNSDTITVSTIDRNNGTILVLAVNILQPETVIGHATGNACIRILVGMTICCGHFADGGVIDPVTAFFHSISAKVHFIGHFPVQLRYIIDKQPAEAYQRDWQGRVQAGRSQRERAPGADTSSADTPGCNIDAIRSSPFIKPFASAYIRRLQ